MMNITLNTEQERLIAEQLSHGNYQSADEVVTKALQLLARQQQEYAEWVADVRAKTDEAAAELARGEGIPLDTFMTEIQAKFQRSREANG
jgi:antitoxin ParD1/3/4